MIVCRHAWIDPADPPRARALYSPDIGSSRRQMKPGIVYMCRDCLTTMSLTRRPSPAPVPAPPQPDV